MKKTYLQRGFTLIELLVVIAIIGILSSVVLASLSIARNKGKDASVQAQLSAMRSQAELFYSTTGNNTYGTAMTLGNCSGATAGAGSLFALLVTNSLANLFGGQVVSQSPQCVVTAGGAAYAVSAALPSDSTKHYCVDSAGNSKGSATVDSTATAAGTCS